MKKHFIAAAPAGAEFCFRKSSMIAVPSASAARIAEDLTAQRYQLKPGEVWHVYENDFYYNDFIAREIRTYSRKRETKVYKYLG